MTVNAEAKPATGTCRVCGCTEQRACEGGCAWVDLEQTLCSSCARKNPAYQFRRADVRPCSCCGQGVFHDGQLIFYRVRIETFVLDPRGVQRTHGLEQFFGGGRAGAVLANVMGDDPPLAIRICDPTQALLCQTCSLEGAVIPRLLERDDESVQEPRRNS